MQESERAWLTREWCWRR